MRDERAYEDLKTRAKLFSSPPADILLRQATRDESAAKEARDAGDKCEGNKLLAHSGDAVIELVVRKNLRDRHPEWSLKRINDEADLIVENKSLANRARALRVGPALELGAGGKSRESTKTLARAFEAIIGAAFLVGGYDKAEALALEWLALPAP